MCPSQFRFPCAVLKRAGAKFTDPRCRTARLKMKQKFQISNFILLSDFFRLFPVRVENTAPALPRRAYVPAAPWVLLVGDFTTTPLKRGFCPFP